MKGTLYLAIALSALVTMLLRVVPILLSSRLRLPPWMRDWLGFVPAAIMSAIVVSELLHKPARSASGASVSMLAAVIAATVGLISRSLFLTVLAGVVAFLILRYALGTML